MPFVRFSRDKRGYEHTYLLHASSKKGANPRILYWYRTPPGVKVGRLAFDDVVRRTLEAQYPSVAFDWDKIADTPMPTVEVEPWRERRRAERAVKQARQAAARDDRQEPNGEPQADSGEPAQTEPETVGLNTQEGEFAGAQVHEFAAAQVIPPSGETVNAEAPAMAPSEAQPSADSSRKRRRRGGRRRRRPGPPVPGAPPEPTE